MCALFFVLALSVGFAQAADRDSIRRNRPALLCGAGAGRDKRRDAIAKNPDAVLPIASITKLMTAMVILDRGLDLEQRDRDQRRGHDASRARARACAPARSLTRDELLLLALMSSENRAAARSGPHLSRAARKPSSTAMNDKAAALGMNDTRFVDPTGLSPANVSSARDLASMVRAAHEYPLIRQYSTQSSATVQRFGRPLQLPQHQRPGAQRALGHRPVEDRLHQRGRPLPGDARASGSRAT